MYHISVKSTVNHSPVIVKSYPHRIQCETWLIIKGHVSHGRNKDWLDRRITIVSDKPSLVDYFAEKYAGMCDAKNMI